MRKIVVRIAICLGLVAFFWCGSLISDRQRLRESVIRLHIVANSDSPEDQARKLQVRDAVIMSLQEDLQKVKNPEQARLYLQEKLPYIQSIAVSTLRTLGCGDGVTVSLCKEGFDTRVYNTFSLPAGIYQALRIVIGEGEGKNWWCVVFPEFCVPAGSSGFEAVAADAGFPKRLYQSLSEQENYELRFMVLDTIGKLEAFLFDG